MARPKTMVRWCQRCYRPFDAPVPTSKFNGAGRRVCDDCKEASKRRQARIAKIRKRLARRQEAMQ